MRPGVLAAFVVGVCAPANADILTGQDLAQRIDAALAAAGRTGRAEMSANRMFPACAAALEIDVTQAARTRVRCPATGWARSFRITSYAPAPVQTSGAAEVVVLAQSLGRGTVLQPGHLRTVPADLARNHAPIVALDRAVGRTLRVNLGQGQTLLARHLEQNWAVTTQAPVTISVLRNGIRIEATGTPQDDAQLGEPVSVLNLSSGRILRGVVTGKNYVSVGANMRQIGAVIECDRRDTSCKGR
ncbi:MAG: flagellar basal body P-ring formation chaperone FlgA [Pseudomonadota bacterium]